MCHTFLGGSQKHSGANIADAKYETRVDLLSRLTGPEAETVWERHMQRTTMPVATFSIVIRSSIPTICSTAPQTEVNI